MQLRLALCLTAAFMLAACQSESDVNVAGEELWRGAAETVGADGADGTATALSLASERGLGRRSLRLSRPGRIGKPAQPGTPPTAPGKPSQPGKPSAPGDSAPPAPGGPGATLPDEDGCDPYDAASGCDGSEPDYVCFEEMGTPCDVAEENCASDAGCTAIIECALATGCFGIECYLFDNMCREVIDDQGGPFGVAAALASELMSCGPIEVCYPADPWDDEPPYICVEPDAPECDWEQAACEADSGCAAIIACAEATECRSLGCYAPDTCQGVIDAAGGLGSPSVGLALQLDGCLHQVICYPEDEWLEMVAD